MVDDGRTDDGRTDGRTTEHGYTIRPCEPDGSGELKREITLTEWAPSPLNLPERKNTGPLNFHIQTTYQISRS